MSARIALCALFAVSCETSPAPPLSSPPALPSAAPATSPNPLCSLECASTGRCEAASATRCMAVHASHCLVSEGCRTNGNCSLVDKNCLPTLPSHCERSERCKDEGACGVVPSKGCFPTKPEHCAASKGCFERGACTLVGVEGDKACGVGTHADCAKTALCREQGRCWVQPTRHNDGTCIQAELGDRARFPLSEARHGVSGELVLRVDTRMPKVADPRGYFPYDDEPRANAVLEIRPKGGEPRDLTEVYPAVEVEKRDLGAGTDAFFVTEQWICVAGHWCGWNTSVFEVRSGRLVSVEAEGDGDKKSYLSMTASQGSRWKVTRGSSPGMRDVVVQSEGPIEPALTETRYFFESGRWRFTEREFQDFDPRVLKQPGAWNGMLEFHDR